MKTIRHLGALFATFFALAAAADDIELSLDEDGEASETEEPAAAEAKEEPIRWISSRTKDSVEKWPVVLRNGESISASLPSAENRPGFTFGCRASGTGLIMATCLARTVYQAAAPLAGTKENSKIMWPLLPRERPYCGYGNPTPLGTKRVTVEFTAVGGTVTLAQPHFAALTAPRKPITAINRSQKTLPPGYVMGRELPCPAGQVDLAPFADYVAENGFPARTRLAVDGSFGTRESSDFSLRFPVAVTLSEVRLTLPQGDVLVYADADGDGAYETPLVEIAGDPVFGTWTDMPEYVWYVKKLAKPVSVHGLYVPGGAWEFRALGPKGERAKLPERPSLPSRAALALGGKIAEPVPAEADRLFFGFTLEPWMFGAETAFGMFYKTGKMASIDAWPAWKGVLKDFDFYGANFTLLFPPTTGVRPPKCTVPSRGSYPAPVLWPSRVWYLNQPNDVLTDFHASCHAHGIASFVIPRDWSFAEGKTEHPQQVLFAQEIAARGADGVPACLDEHMFGFGLGTPEDTPTFRRSYLEKAIRTAAWMADIKADAEKANPKSLTFGGYAGCDYYRERYACVSGFDIWGFEGRVDVIGGDGTYYGVGDAPLGTYAPGVETAVQVACSPKRLSMATLNCNWGTRWDGERKRLKNPLVYDDYPSTAFKAGPLVTYFNKGTYVNFWRYNFIFENGGPDCRAATACAGRLTKILSAWGGKSASVPKDVLVLRSRTSEDWWALKARAKAGKDASAATKQAVELGFTQFFWTAARLCEKAVPYEIYPMHRPETWAKIAKDYKVILLPFAYAVSEQEAAALKAAVDAGVKILAVGSVPFGVADETGAVRAAPLAGVPIERFAFDPLRDKATRGLADRFNAVLAAALEKRGGASLSLATEPDHDVQAYRLDAADGSALLLVANWSERATAAEVRVQLPFDAGKLEVATEEGLFEAPFSKEVRLALPREAVRLLRFSER